MSRATLRELDLTALRQDLPAYGLIAGDVGTVVFVHADGAAYEVELMTADGRTLAVETLLADQVEAVAGDHILHARNHPTSDLDPTFWASGGRRLASQGHVRQGGAFSKRRQVGVCSFAKQHQHIDGVATMLLDGFADNGKRRIFGLIRADKIRRFGFPELKHQRSPASNGLVRSATIPL